MSTLPTLKKISEHLNISVSTVSRALKDHPDVSAETIRRVKELANLMEYEPNGFAVNLRKRQSDTYAILVPEISGYFYHSFIHSVEEEARRQGYGIMIMQSMNNAGIQAENLRICRYNHVAGVFAALSSDTTDLAPFYKTRDIGIPVVFFDKVPESDDFPSVTISDKEGAVLAASQIFTSGKEKVWCIMGDPTMSITQKRVDGFREACAHCEPEISYASSEEEAFELVMQKRKEGIADTAIFCMSDLLLCGTMRALYQLKADIPGQTSVLAMSNGFMPRYFNPVVSYVETSGYGLGKLSMEAMIQLKQEVSEMPSSQYLPCSFHEGASL